MWSERTKFLPIKAHGTVNTRFVKNRWRKTKVNTASKAIMKIFWIRSSLGAATLSRRLCSYRWFFAFAAWSISLSWKSSIIWRFAYECAHYFNLTQPTNNTLPCFWPWSVSQFLWHFIVINWAIWSVQLCISSLPFSSECTQSTKKSWPLASYSSTFPMSQHSPSAQLLLPSCSFTLWSCKSG